MLRAGIGGKDWNVLTCYRCDASDETDNHIACIGPHVADMFDAAFEA